MRVETSKARMLRLLLSFLLFRSGAEMVAMADLRKESHGC